MPASHWAARTRARRRRRRAVVCVLCRTHSSHCAPRRRGLGENVQATTSGRANVEMDAVGFHEVVIESPKHNDCIALQSSKKITAF